MNRTTVLSLIVALAVALGGCGDYLGKYDVEKLDRVAELPSTLRHSRDDAEYFRVELSSDFDLGDDELGDLYVDASFCPFDEAERIVSFGPFTANDPPQDLYQSGPTPRGADGRYRYLVYIAPASGPRKPIRNQPEVFPAYDLSKDERSICLRFLQTGYFIRPSVSDMMTIRPEMFRDARPTTS